MTMFLAPYTAIADIDGSPLDAGFLFFGEFGKDPESHPIAVYWDADFTVPAAQPIRTRNGYPMRNGSPCKIYLKQAEHSLVVKNKNLSAILVEMNNKGISSSLLVRPNGDTVETSLTNIDAELNNKQQQIDEKPSQQYVDEELDLKAPKETTYTKLEVDSALSAKAPQATTYTKAEVDTTFAAYVGGRKAYTTLALAQAAQSSLPANTAIEVTNDGANNGTYQWNGTILTKSAYDPLMQAKSYAEFTSSNAKNEAITALASEGTNLFNDATAIKESKYINASGEITVAVQETDWSYSDYIVVKPNTAYYYDGFRHVAYYTADKTFINRPSIPYAGAGTPSDPIKYYGSLTSPSNAFYVRLNFRNAMPEYVNGRQMVLGSSLLPYQAFGYSLKDYVNIEQSPEWRFGTNNIVDSSITPRKTTFINPSNNLFVLDTVTKNKVISSSGLINDAIDYSISDFIEVTPNTKYTISGDAGYDIFTGAAFYDADKNFVDRYTTTSTGFRILTTGSNTAYVRFNIKHSSGLPEQRNRMFNIGETALPYQRGGVAVLDRVSISDDNKQAIITNALNSVELEYGYIKSKFVKSNNLFDASAATLNKVITSSGVIDDASDYHISDFIAVVAGQKYTLSGESGINAFITTAYYGANKNFIQRVNTYTTSGPLTITIPAGVSYLRFNMNNGLPNQRNRMFNIGEIALPYEAFVSKLANVRLDKEIIDQISGELIIANTNTFMYDLPIDQPYYTDAVWTEYSNFRTITSDQVYAMYDDLASQHPSFITKHSLANNSLGQSIAYYKFKPLIPSVDISNSRKLAKVFLLCGQHGMEHTPPLATFLMLREIYNNWQSSALLEALRFNVEFVVLPVANPDGWNKFTRANPNGVDLNRNYSEGWVYRTDVGFYSGESPFSEIETQNVRQVFDENTDIDVFYDFHNFNGTSAATHPHIIWVSALSNDKQMARMAQCLTSRMTRHWRKEYTFIPQEPYFAGIFDSGPHAGMAASYAKSRGAKLATTFELGNQWWIDPTAVPHDTVHKRTTMEAITNFVLISLNELKRI